MRMWMSSPDGMCDKHLLGEHGELHKFLSSFRREYSITQRVQFGHVQIEPLAMKTRHDELAQEIARRWPEKNNPHRSPWTDNIQTLLAYLPEQERTARVDRQAALAELHARCPECQKRFMPEGELTDGM